MRHTTTNMKFTEKVLNTAIRAFNGELAWKKDDVFQAIDELIENEVAILGGDVWAVRKSSKEISPLIELEAENIAVGIIKAKDGESYVFNWHSNKSVSEDWEEYVLKSKRETIDAINKMKTEEIVAEEFTDSIYYNLVFASKTEFENLMK